jgi:hypothetical protein
MIKLSTLLLEGAYDKAVGEVNAAVFKLMKDAFAAAGTPDNPKTYNGYEIYKDPIPTQKLDDMFEDEEGLDVGEFDTPDGSFDVELKLAISTDAVEPNDVYIDGGAEEDEFPRIEIHIAFNSINPALYSKLQPKLRDLVRHEIEHLTHGRDSGMLKPSKLIRGDKAQRAKAQSDPKLYFKYFLLPKEIDANIHGLYSKAKTLKQPYQKVVDDYLDSLVDDGIISIVNRDKIYNAWKVRIPKIGSIPLLK